MNLEMHLVRTLLEQHDFPYPGTGKGNVTSLALHLSLPLTTFITNNNEWRKRSVTSSIRQYLWDWSSFPVGFVSVCYRSSVLSHLRRVTFDSAVDCLSSPAPLCLFCRSETWRRWLFRRKAQGHLTYDFVACKWILWTGCSTTVVCGTVKVVTPFCRVVVCNPATSSADQSRKKGLW